MKKFILISTILLTWVGLYSAAHAAPTRDFLAPTTTPGCLNIATTGLLWSSGSACGTGTGGGGGGGTWSTTTSTVAGRLINYPNNNTDIVTIGNTATTSAPIYFDPNTLFSKIGSQLLVTGSTTLQNVTYLNSTSTNSTTTGYAHFGDNVDISKASALTKLTITNNDGSTRSPVMIDLANSVGNSVINFPYSGSINLGYDGLQVAIPNVGNLTVMSNTTVFPTGIFQMNVDADVSISSNASNGHTFTFQGPGDIKFNSYNGASYYTPMIIKQAGNVGVGTSSPWGKLSINNSTADVGGQPLFVIASSTASATTTQFIVTNAGNVGIGTSIPSYTLDVQGAGTTRLGNITTDGNNMVLGSANSAISSGSGSLQLYNGGYVAGVLATGIMMNSAGTYGFSAGSSYNTTPDSQISRLAAGSVSIDTSTAGNSLGTLTAGALTVSTDAVDNSVTLANGSGSSGMRFRVAKGGRVGSTGSFSGAIYLQRFDGAFGVGYDLGSDGWNPAADDATNLGNTSYRWKTLSIGTGGITTAGNVGIGTTTPTSKLTVEGTASTSNLIISGLGNTSTKCLQVSSTGVVSAATSACGAGGGGSGGGTWATTTTTVAGTLINYPLNDTDIVAVGSNATTTPPFVYFDPNTKNIISEADWNTGTTLGTINSGAADRSILLWHTNKSAFRAGEWDIAIPDSDIGDDGSAAFGYDTKAKGISSFAIGDRSVASGYASFAGGGGVGSNDIALSTGNESFAFGTGAHASGDGAVAFASYNIASGTDAFSVGYHNIVGENSGTLYGAAVGGEYNNVQGDDSVTVGGDSNNITGLGNYSTVLGGARNYVDAAFGTALGGQDSNIGGDGALTMGDYLVASGTRSFTIGSGVSATSKLINNQKGFIYIGQNSDLPTLVIASSTGVGTTGKVGVATTSPSAKFAVAGDTFLGGNLTATGTILFSSLTGTQCLHETNGVVTGTGSDCGSGGGGGSDKWSTTSNTVALTPNGGTAVGVVIGRAATTTNSFLEVNGTTTAVAFNATGTDSVSSFQRLTAKQSTTTDLAITNITSSILKTNGNGSVIAAVSGTDYSNFGPSVGPTELLSADFGDFTCNGTTCSLDTTYAIAARNINTTYPVQGGGDLSADRTITLAFGTTTNNNWSGGNVFQNASSTFVNGVTMGRSTTTNATTTNLGITGLLSKILKTDGNGTVVGATAGTDYLVTVTADTPLSGSGTSGSHLVIANSAADGSTKGAASFTANDFDASSGNISLDYTNAQASSGSLKGFLTSTDWTTFNNKQNIVWASTTSDTNAIYNVGVGTVNVGTSTSNRYATLTVASNTPAFMLSDINGGTDAKHFGFFWNSGIFSLGTTTDVMNSTSTLIKYNPLGAGTLQIGTSTDTTTVTTDVFSTATTTIRLDSNSATKGSCIVMKDFDGAGYTYVIANNGVLTASTVDCR